MRAIVLVGGAGTRLRPLTWRTPKQLVPILNRPLLEHLLLHLQAHGVTRVTLALTDRSEAIRNHFGDGRVLGIDLEYAYEPTPLGSGGAIAAVAEDWREPFLVLNGDIISDLDLSAMISSHQARGALLTMHLHEVDDPSSFGVAVTASDGRIAEFVEKPPLAEAPSRLVNAGAWIFEPELVREMDPTTFNRVEDGLFPALCRAERPIFGFSPGGYWRDIGNAEALRLVNLDLLLGAISDTHPSGTLVGEESVAVGATIRAPSVVGRRCQIGPGATIERSVIWDDVTIGRGAVVRDSVVANGAAVGDRATIERSVIAHSAQIHAGTTLADASVGPDATVEAGL